jgi:hypothetical protein
MPRNNGDPITYVNYGVADSNSDQHHANHPSHLAQSSGEGTDPHHANHSSHLSGISYADSVGMDPVNSNQTALYYTTGKDTPIGGGDVSVAPIWNRIPRFKHLWTIRPRLTSGARDLITSKGYPEDQLEALLSELTYRAQSVDLPTWQIATQTLNQYNKPRLVHTKVEWQPVTIKFLDTVDNAFQELLLMYNSYYFPNNFNGAGASAMSPDQLSLEFNGSYGARAVNDTDDNFFFSIEILREFAGQITAVSIINPKITAVQHDGMDYTDTGSFLTWTVTLSYETAVFHKTYKAPWQLEAAPRTGNDAADNGGDPNVDEITPDGDTSGFSNPDENPAPNDLMDWQEPGVEPKAAAGDELQDPWGNLSGPPNGNSSKPPANLAEQIGGKIKSLKDNVSGKLGGGIKDLSIGGIPVGKAINPTTISAALAIGTTLKRKGLKGLTSNPVALGGAIYALAKQLPAIGGGTNDQTNDEKINKVSSQYDQYKLDKMATEGYNVGGIADTSKMSSLQQFLRK